MNLYKLESKSIDEDFLNGIPIECIAMISVQDYHAGLIKEGDKIVVMLSNGKKYMGKVTGFTFSSIKTLLSVYWGLSNMSRHSPFVKHPCNKGI